MRKNGFTLVEVIIAMTVGAVIMAAVYGYMTLVQKNSANMDRKVVTLQDTRAVLDLMAGEIRVASYDPHGKPRAVIWNTIPACAQMAGWGWGGTAVPDNRGIQVANANTIFVAMDLDEDGTIGNAAAAGEYVMYHYDGQDTSPGTTITRNVSCGGNSAILGGNAPDSNVRNAAAGVPLFQYFDSTNTQISAPVSTANIPNIRRILITIVADTAANDLNTHQPRRVVYSTSVMVRNHAY